MLDSTLARAALETELRRQVAAGRVEWDVVALDAPRLAILARDPARPLARLVPDDTSTALPTWLREVGVAVLDDTLALAVRNGPFRGARPASWPEAWDAARFPGPRALPREPASLLEIALLADGAAHETLYPLDLDRAFAALERLRPAVRNWWQEADQPGEALMLGQDDLTLARAGDLRAALERGALAARAPLPQPALTLTLAIPEGAPNSDVARDFLARAVAPAARAALAAHGYAAPGAAGENTFRLDLDWWGERGTDADQRFARWLDR